MNANDLLTQFGRSPNQEGTYNQSDAGRCRIKDLALKYIMQKHPEPVLLTDIARCIGISPTAMGMRLMPLYDNGLIRKFVKRGKLYYEYTGD